MLVLKNSGELSLAYSYDMLIEAGHEIEGFLSLSWKKTSGASPKIFIIMPNIILWTTFKAPLCL